MTLIPAPTQLLEEESSCLSDLPLRTAESLSAVHAPWPVISRTDIDHYPAWIAENPALFAQSVRKFLADHPGEQWDCRISTFAGYIVRLTAIAKTGRGAQ